MKGSTFVAPVSCAAVKMSDRVLRAVAAGVPLTCGALVMHMYVPMSFEQAAQIFLYGERLSISDGYQYRYLNVMRLQDCTSLLFVHSGPPYGGTRKRGDIILD